VINLIEYLLKIICGISDLFWSTLNQV
jgi:hypothetical protein